tara:strand:+ start:7213 stop:7959 length:747 start_codon:yes stop_codon:yes gene_type:complete
MISLLNFIDTGFMITLGLLILVSGGIMLYSYRRLNLLENSIIEHGKILQNFIVNYNNQILVNQQVLNNSLYNSPQANLENTSNNINNINNTNNINNKNNTNNEDKIVVSDDDSHSNVSDTDSDNNENESENESEEYSSNESENEENDKKEVLNLESKEVLEETNDNDAFLNNLPIDLNQLDLKLDSKIIKLESLENETNENNDKTTNEKKNYSRMKVDELRTLVVTKNLTSNEDALTMKKNDLLKLLQ